MNGLTKTVLVYFIHYLVKSVLSLKPPLAEVDQTVEPVLDTLEEYNICDRIAAISWFEFDKKTNKSIAHNIATGILLDDMRVLTSFNPFKELLQDKAKMAITNVIFKYKDKYYARKIACARAVVPKEDETIRVGQWHGAERIYTGLHDLLVIRVFRTMNISRITDKTINKVEANTTINLKDHNLELTELARKGDKLEKKLVFVSLGLTAHEPISVYRRLQVSLPDHSDLRDCGHWIPNNWGLFFCFINDDNHIGFASSALLFPRLHSNKLYGVGSFTLFRGAASIVTFTDVRYYTEAIKNTCTDEDAKMLYYTYG